ncbi:MAG: hypothetical protein R3C01_05910 [Planctomycetaceae bacterium]
MATFIQREYTCSCAHRSWGVSSFNGRDNRRRETMTEPLPDQRASAIRFWGTWGGVAFGLLVAGVPLFFLFYAGLGSAMLGLAVLLGLSAVQYILWVPLWRRLAREAIDEVVEPESGRLPTVTDLG